jgi:hypothetical protein
MVAALRLVADAGFAAGSIRAMSSAVSANQPEDAVAS